MHRWLAKAPLRMILIIPFVVQVSAAVGLTAWLSIRNGQQAVNDVTQQLRQETTARVNHQVVDMLMMAQSINQLTAQSIQRNDLNLTDIRTLADVYWDYINAFPMIQGLGAGNQNGDILALFQRGEAGSITYFLEYSTPDTEQTYVSLQLNQDRQVVQAETLNRDIDATQRPWYQAAAQAAAPVWTAVYPSISAVEGHTLAMNASRPIYDEAGQLEGVVSVILDLGQISQRLEAIEFSPSGQIFIVDADGNLIGSSDGNNPVSVKGEAVSRLPAAQSENRLIRASIEYLYDRLGEGFDDIDQALQLEFQLEGERQFLQITPVQAGEQLSWFVVVTAPESDFMGQIYAQTRNTLWLCLGALVLATGSSMLTARWIAKPLRQLSQAATSMAQGQWKPAERRAAIAAAQSQEISNLAQSFSQMALQLNASFAALQASEAQFRSLADNVPGCIFRYILHPNGTDTISYASSGCYDLWEITATVIQQDVGRLWDMIHPDDVPIMRDTIAASAQTLQTWQQEWRIISPSGQQKWLRGAGNPNRQPSGDVVWVTVVSDISDRKQAALALEQELLLSKTLFDTSIDGIVLLDHRGDVLQTSASFAHLLGYTVAETCMLNLRDWDAQWSHEELQTILQGKMPLPPQFETRHRRKDGSVYDVEISYSREVLNGETVHFCICRNISDRKQAATQLQDLTDRLGLAVQAAKMGIWDWDIPHNRLRWDQRLYEIMGLHPADFGNTLEAWEAVVHPDDLPHCQAATQQALRGEGGSPLVFRGVRPDGAIVYIESHFLVERDGAGNALRMIGVNLDITDRQALEQALRHQKQLLDTFVHSAPVGKCIVDDQFRFTLVNEALAAMNGVPAADHMGKTLWEIVPDLAAQQAAVLQQVVAAGTAITEIELVGETPLAPGQRRTWLASYFPLPSPDGTTLAIGAVVIETTARSQAEQALRASEEKFRQVAENIQEVFWLTTAANDQVLYVSPAYETIWGRSCASVYADPTSFIEAIVPADRPLLKQALEHPDSPVEVEYRVMRPDGTVRWIWDRRFPIFDDQGQLGRRAGLAQDITDRKQAETQLQDLTDRLGLAAQAANMGIWEWDLVNDHLLWDERMYRLYGVSPEDFQNVFKGWAARVHPEDFPLTQTSLQQALAGEQDYNVEFRILWPDGTVRYLAGFATVQRDNAGQPIRMVGANLDISDRKQVEAQLLHNALHDALTGLPNRTFLTNRLELALQRAQQFDRYGFAVLFLDLDRFKVINDSLGHLVGDQLLKTIARRLHLMVRPTDVAARLGGDEFVILLEDIVDVQAAVQVAQRLLTEFEAPIAIDDHQVFINTSIGIVWGNTAYQAAADLLRDADIALYRAKAAGRGRYAIFDVKMHAQAVQRMTLEHDLREAVNQQAFTPYYQPIVDLHSRQLTGFEALIRWCHPTRGLISPAEFIPVAEETGMIVPISIWMLRTTCQQLATWRQQFPEMADLRMSVNLSSHDLFQTHLLETLRQIFHETQLSPHHLTLEITESVLIENVEAAIQLLHQFRSQGIRISIDDFGTGYSSLSYLYNLPVDYLKIDQSFVSQMQQGDKNYKIVQAVMGLSDQLQLAAIAEGIETEQQLAWLKTLNCELGQGYLFAKPLPAEAATELLNRGGHFIANG